MRADESALLGRPRPFGMFLDTFSRPPIPSSGVPSEGDKRDSKGGMLGIFPRRSHRQSKRRGSTQQKPLCSGASNSDSAERDLWTDTRGPSGAQGSRRQRLIEGVACATLGLGWSRLLGNSYATRRAVSEAHYPELCLPLVYLSRVFRN